MTLGWRNSIHPERSSMATRKASGVAVTVKIIHGDCLEEIPKLVAAGTVVDSVCCDPPYNLTATAARFGKNGSAPAKHGKDGAYQRVARGFMSSVWDTDVAFHPETWATVATIMRPGAFLVAFGGTRTAHRLTCAIDDAGFIIQDSILDLISTDSRVQRFVATLTPAQVDAFSQVLDDMQPTGALAWAFATGFPKRRDMLKPAFEPIVLAYKPGGKRSMQIDECRVGTEGSAPAPRTGGESNGILGNGLNGGWGAPVPGLGRWPANVSHSGDDEVLAAFPNNKPGKVGMTKHGSGTNSVYGNFTRSEQSFVNNGVSDTGSAARFFFSAKAGAQDRWGSRHPTVKPVELMKWLVALVTPPGGTCIDPFAGSGTTGVAALATGRNAILIEREAQYHADILERMAHYEGAGRHSLASKGRQARQRGELPLFDRSYDEAVDAHDSYLEAVKAIGNKVKSGAPVPPFFLSDRPEAAE